MKTQADRQRLDKEFIAENLVYIKLQPYDNFLMLKGRITNLLLGFFWLFSYHYQDWLCCL